MSTDSAYLNCSNAALVCPFLSESMPSLLHDSTKEWKSCEGVATNAISTLLLEAGEGLLELWSGRDFIGPPAPVGGRSGTAGRARGPLASPARRRLAVAA
mmetsp:Transcript_48595/g.141562  ORF Transcript_48595/g.141562 Transcript_48595/m.141562 type:complete len:100 (-) Transcript_48595:7-306(-)